MSEKQTPQEALYSYSLDSLRAIQRLRESKPYLLSSSVPEPIPVDTHTLYNQHFARPPQPSTRVITKTPENPTISHQHQTERLEQISHSHQESEPHIHRQTDQRARPVQPISEVSIPEHEFQPQSYDIHPRRLHWQQDYEIFDKDEVVSDDEADISLNDSLNRSIDAPRPFSVRSVTVRPDPLLEQPTFIRVTIPTTTLLHRYRAIHQPRTTENSVSLQADITQTNNVKWRNRTFEKSKTRWMK